MSAESMMRDQLDFIKQDRNDALRILEMRDDYVRRAEERNLRMLELCGIDNRKMRASIEDRLDTYAKHKHTRWAQEEEINKNYEKHKNQIMDRYEEEKRKEEESRKNEKERENENY